MLEFFICGMLLAVTFLLVLVIYKSETAYTIYSKILIALSVTLPLSVGLIAIPAVGQGDSLVGSACLFRVFAAPPVMVGLGMSRLFARFPKAKRLSNYALAIEAGTVGFLVLMPFLSARFFR